MHQKTQRKTSLYPQNEVFGMLYFGVDLSKRDKTLLRMYIFFPYVKCLCNNKTKMNNISWLIY